MSVPNVSPKPSPVPFVLQVKVRAIHEQVRALSRSTSRGDTGPALVKMRRAVEDIRERLERDGVRDEAAILSAVRAAAAQAGFDTRETDEIAAAFQAGGQAAPSPSGQ